MMKWSRLVLAVAAVLAPLSVPASAQRAQLAMLNQIENGRWELRLRDGGGTEQICLNDKSNLIQLRHPSTPCDRTVISDGASEVTVQYVCRGRGYGRTHIRRETDELIQLDTQGIANGLPFAFAAEGRRVGDCAP